jgi:hypothetical protein
LLSASTLLFTTSLWANTLCQVPAGVSIPIYDKSLSERTKLRNQTKNETTPVGYLIEKDIFECEKNQKLSSGEFILDTNKNQAFIYAPDSKNDSNKQIRAKLKPISNQPIQVYLDGTPGGAVQVFKEPGENWKDVEKDPSQRIALLKVGDETKAIFVKKSKWICNYYDPSLHTTDDRLFYNVDVIDSKNKSAYLNPKLNVQAQSGWIDSLKTRAQMLPLMLSQNEKTESSDKCCEEREPMNLELIEKKNLLEDLVKIKNPELIKVAANQISDLSCLSDHTAPLIKATPKNENLVSEYKKVWKRKFLKNNFKNAIKNVIKKNSSPDLNSALTIDALARTMFGESRDCHYNVGDRYSYTVARVILNRARNCNENSICPFENSNLLSKNINDHILGVIQKNRQFSTWNLEDNNIEAIMCIPKDEVSQTVWKECVEIATQAVLEPEYFNWHTREVRDNTFDYYSPIGGLKNRPPRWVTHREKEKTNLVHKQNISIDGLPVDNYKCFKFYETVNKTKSSDRKKPT